jgi:hypothetical protein
MITAERIADYMAEGMSREDAIRRVREELEIARQVRAVNDKKTTPGGRGMRFLRRIVDTGMGGSMQTCEQCSHYEMNDAAMGRARHICWIAYGGAPAIGDKCPGFDEKFNARARAVDAGVVNYE